MKRIAGVASVGLTLLSLGCGASDPPPSPGNVKEPIVNGYVDDDDKAAVGLAINVFNYFSGHCSGTLIAPNLVLTARHCVSLTQGGTPQGGVICGQTNFGLTGSGQMFRVTTKTVRPEQDGADFYKGTGSVVVPQESTDICGNDVALIILEGAGIPESDTKPIIPRIDSRPEQHELYSAVGYGLTDPNNQGSSGTRMRIDGKLVNCLGGLCSGFIGESVKETEWMGEGDTCPGDSGGPALDAQGRVMGVLSRGAQPCLTSVYGDVSKWKDLIIDTAKKAAESGGYPVPFWAETGSSIPPPEPDAGSDAGQAGATCSGTAPCAAGLKCYATSGDTGTCVAPCDQTPCATGVCDETLKVCLAETKQKASSGDDGGCAVNASGQKGSGPVKPQPWVFAAIALFLARARSRRVKP